MPSMVNQVEMALLSVFRPGWKKHQMPADQRQNWIYSGRTLEVYLYHCCRWAKWAREQLGIARLVEAHLGAQPWVQQMIDSGRSAWTIAAAISAIRKLEVGIDRRWGRQVTLIVPDSLVQRPRRRLAERIRKGAYPLADLQLLRAFIADEYRPVLDACLALGLRRHEVIAVRACDVDLAATAYQVKEKDATWSSHPIPPGYQGVVRVRRGKGGRSREVPVPVEFRRQLEALLQSTPGEDRLWPVQAIAFGEEILSACQRAQIPSRGVHGLRHSWALEQYSHLRRLGYSDPEARQIVSWWLGHNRLAVTLSYIPRNFTGKYDKKYSWTGGQ